MPLSALAMVVVAALIHATWNLWVKRAGAAGVPFFWGTALASTIVYAPLVLGLYGDRIADLGTPVWIAVAASGILHIAYFLALNRGYAVSDLSLVYPVARGVGPMLATVGAIVWLGEQATLMSATGLVLIVAGTFTLAGGWAMLSAPRSPRIFAGLFWGGVTGLLIAAYTVNDGRAVRLLAVAPLLFDWLSVTTRMLLLTPAALAHPPLLRETVARAWRTMLAVGVLSPLAYILVLQAMTIAPVSHVAPARELSMLVAAFFGVRLLGEGHLLRRLAGAALIAAGVVCLAM